MSDNTLFHESNVRQFAAAWYLALDIHAPVEACVKFLADTDLEMVFPEKTLYGHADFQAWYAGGTYTDGEATTGVTNIFFDENHTVVSVAVPSIVGAHADLVEATIVVAWQASWFEQPHAKAKRTALDATQTWTLRPCSRDKNPYGVEIVTYNAFAEPFKYAPGFARLA